MKSYHLSFVSGSAPGFVSRAGAGEMFGLGKCSSTVLALEEFGVPVELAHRVGSLSRKKFLFSVRLVWILGLLVLARRSGSWGFSSASTVKVLSGFWD